MKFISSSGWLVRLFAGDRKAGQLKLLQQQRMLLHTGIEATAEVMNTTLFEDRVGSMLPVRLWLKLKKADGSIVYTHTQSLVTPRQIPGKGQVLRIKYLPENMSSILILG